MKIVERDPVALVLEAAACRDDLVVRPDRLENFEHHAVFRQKRAVVAHEKIAGAVDEGQATLREMLRAKEEEIVGRGSRGKIQLGVGEEIFQA